LNVEAIFAENAESGLALVKDKDLNIWLLDIALGPGMDGIGLCIRLKKDSRYANVPAIAITAFAKDNLAKFEAAGFSSYLSKPYTADQLN